MSLDNRCLFVLKLFDFLSFAKVLNLGIVNPFFIVFRSSFFCIFPFSVAFIVSLLLRIDAIFPNRQ